MSFTTPALLFPAISLLLLAYTNRFLVLAQLIRQLNGANKEEMREIILRQLSNLRKRLLLIKLMQTFGVVSFLLCTFSMLSLFLEVDLVGKWLFGMSLITLSISLLFSLYEVVISMDAINAELENIES
ncbi:MAG: II family cellulose-binding protein [SAR324 cluster bacterium]|uniref:II family cellulose-binding protein n=1 Tax=SAR324 cluster bacterium TaxID=2024889 RepID=A0A2A4SKE6_9DELT|nr:MAG: II family cellulose-binding protein [SAR324 cluster bacterium]